MSVVQKIEKWMPSPFTIAVLLTVVAFVLAGIFTTTSDSATEHYGNLINYWNKGFWELLSFGMQMVLMLLLGHVIALSKPVDKLIQVFTSNIKSGAQAAYLTTLLTILVSLFNWGLGLIFGAILARKFGEQLQKQRIEHNYPLIAACGYVGLMVWHGGLSGSAPLKVADEGHFLVDKIGVITVDQTVFSTMNIVCMILLIALVPFVMYLIGKRSSQSNVVAELEKEANNSRNEQEGSQLLDRTNMVGWFLGAIMLIYCVYVALSSSSTGIMGFVNTNYINFLLFGLAVVLHGSVNNFTGAAQKAVEGTLGIILQFPLYAGIMGIMKYSGLTLVVSEAMVAGSSEWSLPALTMISSGLVNILVPSGGGQWAVQGEIVVSSAQVLGVSIPKNIMALAYGDQLTNMLQPFWALPLLGITKLQAKHIFPYTFMLFLVGLSIFLGILLIF